MVVGSWCLCIFVPARRDEYVHCIYDRGSAAEFRPDNACVFVHSGLNCYAYSDLRKIQATVRSQNGRWDQIRLYATLYIILTRRVFAAHSRLLVRIAGLPSHQGPFSQEIIFKNSISCKQIIFYNSLCQIHQKKNNDTVGITCIVYSSQDAQKMSDTKPTNERFLVKLKTWDCWKSQFFKEQYYSR